MIGAVMSALNSVLKGQASRLVGLADDYKRRTIYEIKTEVKSEIAGAGVMAGLGVVGLFFMMVAVVAGLAALFHWVSLRHGPLAGYAAAGGVSLILGLLTFTVLAVRANADKPEYVPPELSQIKADAKDALRQSQNAVTNLASTIKSDLGSTVEAQARALGRQTLDAATGAVRNGSSQTLMITIAATAVIGLLLGRSARS